MLQIFKENENKNYSEKNLYCIYYLIKQKILEIKNNKTKKSIKIKKIVCKKILNIYKIKKKNFINKNIKKYKYIKQINKNKIIYKNKFTSFIFYTNNTKK